MFSLSRGEGGYFWMVSMIIFFVFLKEVFRLDLMKFLEKYYLVVLLIVSYSGFFYKIVLVGKSL